MTDPTSCLWEMHVDTMESLIQQCVDGSSKIVSNGGNLQKEDIQSILLLENIPIKTVIETQDASSATLECQVLSKKMTSKDKKNISVRKCPTKVKKKSHTYQILHPDSISEEKALSPFWKESNVEKYEQLSWLPKIDWQGLVSNSSNGYAVNTEQLSWFSITTIQHLPKTSEKTCCPSYKFTVVGGTEEEDTKKVVKSVKIRICPTKEQKRMLNKWASHHRYTYNKTLNSLNKKQATHRTWKSLRNRFVTAKSRKNVKNNFLSNKQWLLQTPKSVRESAVKEARKNLSTCMKQRKNNTINKFFLRYKSRKHEKSHGWTFGIEKNNVLKEGNHLWIFKKILGEMKYRSVKQLNKFIKDKRPSHDPKIQKDKYGDYYLILSYEVAPKKVQKTHEKVASLDTGVTVYTSVYDPRGKAYIIGKGVDQRLLDLLEKLDSLFSIYSKTKGTEARKQVRQQIIKLRKYISNLKQELHNQVNNFLTKNFSLILYPKLDTQKLTLRERRTLTTKTVRKMLNLGHCSAFEKAKHKALERGVALLDPSEAYTTKTCSVCGKIQCCGNDRVYRCECGYVAERDLHGAQNVLLRSI